MTQADCVVLMLAYAATIPVVLLTAGSNGLADPIASRRCWGTLPRHRPEQSSSWAAVPKDGLSGGVRSSVRWISSHVWPVLTGKTRLEARTQSIDCGRDVGFRPEPWIGAAGGCSHRHLHGDLAGKCLVRPGAREETAATPDAGLLASELFRTSSLEGRAALPEGSLRLRTNGE